MSDCVRAGCFHSEANHTNEVMVCTVPGCGCPEFLGKRETFADSTSLNDAMRCKAVAFDDIPWNRIHAVTQRLPGRHLGRNVFELLCEIAEGTLTNPENTEDDKKA